MEFNVAAGIFHPFAPIGIKEGNVNLTTHCTVIWCQTCGKGPLIWPERKHLLPPLNRLLKTVINIFME